MVITRQKPKKSNAVLRPYDHLPSQDLDVRARSRGLFFKPPLQEFVIKHAIHADYVSEESLPRHISLQTSCEVDACYQRPHHNGPQFGNRMTECLLPCRDKQITKRTAPGGSRGAISQTQSGACSSRQTELLLDPHLEGKSSTEYVTITLR